MCQKGHSRLRYGSTSCGIGIDLSSYSAAHSYMNTNVKSTPDILEAAQDLNVSKVVITSMSEVYGTAQRITIDEGHPSQAQSP
jgi:nucleoside-diphosphate-sugar epimerase